MRRRLLVALLVAFGTAWTSPLATLAHTPTAGAADQYAQDITLDWQFVNGSNSWPSYAKTAVREALNHDGSQLSDWANPASNQSGMPDYDEVTGGGGRLIWQAQSGSPCDGNPSWIGCNPPHATGALNWSIYVRDFTGAPRLDWHWVEHPSATGTLFLLERVALHEAMHNVLDIPNHDSQSTTVTIMQASTPAQGNAGWNTQQIQDCDEAAAQLEYDVKVLASPYSDCFDHITNHGTVGLKTKLNIASADTTKCVYQSVVFTGTLAVGSDATNYKTLSSNPLGTRTVTLERAPVGTTSFSTVASTTTQASQGTFSFSVTQTSPQTGLYRTRYAGQAGQGLDPRYSSETLTASWSTGGGCPT